MQKVKLQPNGKKTVLELLTDAKIHCFSECCSGYCGTCKINLLEGNVSYIEPPLIDCDSSFILACCCYPLTDIVVIL